MLPEIPTFMLPVITKIEAEEHGFFFKIDENSFPPPGKTKWHGRIDSLLSCSQMCARRANCKITNFIPSQGTCALLQEEQAKQTQKRIGGADHSRLKKGLFCLSWQVSLIHYYSGRLQLCASKISLSSFNVLLQKGKCFDAGYFTKLEYLRKFET